MLGWYLRPRSSPATSNVYTRQTYRGSMENNQNISKRTVRSFGMRNKRRQRFEYAPDGSNELAFIRFKTCSSCRTEMLKMYYQNRRLTYEVESKESEVQRISKQKRRQEDYLHSQITYLLNREEMFRIKCRNQEETIRSLKSGLWFDIANRNDEQIRTLKLKCWEMETEIINMKDKNYFQTSQIDSLIRKIQRHEDRHEEMKRKEESLQSEIRRLHERNETLQQAEKDMQITLQNVRQNYGARLIFELECDLKNEREKVSSLQNDLKKLKRENENYATLNRQMESKSSKMLFPLHGQRVDQEYSELKSNELRKNLEKERGENARLKSRSKEKDEEIKKLQVEVMQVKNDRRKQDEMYQNISKEKDEDVKKLETELRQIKNERRKQDELHQNAATETIDKIKRQESLLEKQSSELESARRQVRTADTEIERLKQNILSLLQENENTQAEKENMAKRIKESEEEINRLNLQLPLSKHDIKKGEEHYQKLAIDTTDQTQRQDALLVKKSSELESANDEVQRAKLEIKQLKQDIENFRRERDNSLLKNEAEKEKLTKRNKESEEEIERLNLELALVKNDLKKQEENHKKSIQEKNDIALMQKAEIHEANNDISLKEKAIEKLKLELEEKEEMLHLGLEEAMRSQSYEKENAKLQERISQLVNENKRLETELSHVSREKDDALTRLSKVAGAKLTHGNAAITDLSDGNRPTKIAEKFSELYDNQWTDSFEELDEIYGDEKATVAALLGILKEAYSFCVAAEEMYSNQISEGVFTIQDPTTQKKHGIKSDDVPVQKALSDIKLAMGSLSGNIVEEMFLARLPDIVPGTDTSSLTHTLMYARRCIHLSWMMRIRDPPVYIRFEYEAGSSFDTDLLRRYTKVGHILDFIVWPALYLHYNGPLLAKGVAQPM